MMSENGKFTMLGVTIGRGSLLALTDEAMSLVNGRPGQIAFACANPHSLVAAKSDCSFSEALNSTEQVVADGIGTVLAAKLAGTSNLQRIAGADYFYSIMNALDLEGGKRVFFMGSTKNVLGLIKQKVAREYPGIEGVGVLSPPFGEWSDGDNKLIIKTINDFRPDVLWVGMTAPKQEKWVSSSRNELNVPVIGFDFYAGTHPRAPEWMHKNGLEWLFRLIREPRRMWRRNFVSTPKFIWLILLERIKKLV